MLTLRWHINITIGTFNISIFTIVFAENPNKKQRKSRQIILTIFGE